MSIHEEINNRVSEGRLFLLEPSLPGISVERPMFVSAELQKLLFGPWKSHEQERRWNRLRADLDTFVEGRRISVALRPYKARTAYMAQLDSINDEVWEIRSRDPKPGIRVFGRFAETDLFVALTWWWRSDLKGPKSKQWRSAREGCKAEWRKLFPTYPAQSGTQISDYISTKTYLV